MEATAAGPTNLPAAACGTPREGTFRLSGETTEGQTGESLPGRLRESPFEGAAVRARMFLDMEGITGMAPGGPNEMTVVRGGNASRRDRARRPASRRKHQPPEEVANT